MRAAGREWLESWTSLARSGLVASEKKNRRNRTVAIAESFPAHTQLVRFLRHLATHYRLKEPQANGSVLFNQKFEVRDQAAPNVEKIFGWSDRLYVFLALEALGGEVGLRN